MESQTGSGEDEETDEQNHGRKAVLHGETHGWRACARVEERVLWQLRREEGGMLELENSVLEDN